MTDAGTEQKLKNLLMSARNGDNHSYQLFLQGIMKVVKDYIKVRIKNKDLVLDMTQEVMLGIHKALPTYDGQRPLNPWLYSVAKYKLIDYWRKSEKEKDHSEFMEQAHGQHESDQENRYMASEVMSLLKEFTEKERDLVERTKIDGQSIKEVALETGLSESNIKVIVHRVMKALKDMVDGK